MFIQNCSMSDVYLGVHRFEYGNTVLIQIQDVGSSFIKPRGEFLSTFQYRFDDHEELGRPNNCTQSTANSLGFVLEFCKRYRHNVVVHCHSGVSRSGAVVEAGVAMGFEDVGVLTRRPNKLVKQLISNYLKIPVLDTVSPL